MDQSEIERHTERMREKIDKLYLSNSTVSPTPGHCARRHSLCRNLKIAGERGGSHRHGHHSSDLSDDDADISSTVEQVVLRSACPSPA
ncbi:MAG: hypothetical protein ACLUPV_08475 [Bilophila wadsworthia]